MCDKCIDYIESVRMVDDSVDDPDAVEIIPVLGFMPPWRIDDV